MNENRSLEDLLDLLLNGNLNSEERKKIKEEIGRTSEFRKAKTINLIIKKQAINIPSENS